MTVGIGALPPLKLGIANELLKCVILLRNTNPARTEHAWTEAKKAVKVTAAAAGLGAISSCHENVDSLNFAFTFHFLREFDLNQGSSSAIQVIKCQGLACDVGPAEGDEI